MLSMFVPGPQSQADQTQQLIRKSLAEHYHNVIGWIQPLTWNESFKVHIEHIYTNLEMIGEVNHGTREARHPLDSYHDMFKGLGNHVRPRRILVQGKAGVGKSTFTSKLAYDWASGSEHLDSFKTVVLVELKQMKGTVQEAIYQQLFPRDFPISLDQLSKHLTAHQEETLLILDGYDEARASVLSELRDIASGKLLRNACVVMTSRSGKTSQVCRFMDARVEVTGFTTENIRDYVYKYFNDDRRKAESLISELETHPLIEDVAKIPLTAMLICALWEEVPDTLANALSTMTSLFTELILLLIKRHCAKHPQEGYPELDCLASLDDVPEELLQDLLNLGEVAMNGLLSDELIFDLKALEARGLNRRVLELGFLSQETSASRLKPVQKCRFLHKSFQEFFAALWLSNKIKSCPADPESQAKLLEVIKQCVFGSREPLVTGFLAGLLGEHFAPLLTQILEEMPDGSDNQEAWEECFVVLMLAVFESQQSALTHAVGALFQDGVVHLEGMDVTPYGVRAMAFFLQNYPGIKAFLLEQSTLEKHTVAMFGSCISKIPSLRVLYLNQNTIGDGGVRSFQENLSTNLPLEKFTFKTNVCRRDIGKDLAGIMQCCPNLTHLDLSFNSLGDQQMKQVFSALRFVPRLIELRLCGNKLGSEGMAALGAQLRHLPHLTCLDVSRNFEIGAAGVKLLCEVLSRSSPGLRSLSLGLVNFDTESPEPSRVIYSTLGKTVERLPELDHLDLVGNVLFDGEFLGDCVQKATNLTRLDLSGNAFHDAGAKNLAQVLPNLKRLVEIILDKNCIASDGLVALTQVVQFLPELKTLSLRSNKICDRGIAALSQVLPSMRRLEDLVLAYNKVTDSGLPSLLAALKLVSQLKVFNIKGNRLKEDGFRQVASALDSLQNLKVLALGCPVSGRPVSALLESSDVYCPQKVEENGTLTVTLVALVDDWFLSKLIYDWLFLNQRWVEQQINLTRTPYELICFIMDPVNLNCRLPDGIHS